MNIPHISVSRADLYKECPYRYKLKYHDKIPSPIPEPFYFVYGKIIHKIVEVYVLEGGEREIGKVATDVLQGRIHIDNGKCAPKLPTEYKDRLPVHLKNFMDKMGDSVRLKSITEHKFHYDLERPNGKYILGFIDRIIIKDGKAWIVDYKTTKDSRYRKDENTVKFDPQLRMYCRAVQREMNLPAEKIKAALFYLEDGQCVGSSFSEESLAAAERDLLETYDLIKSHPPESARGNIGQHCNRCEYKMMCPFFQNKKRQLSWDGDLSSLKKSTKR